eukprot:1956907-Heterocapsa_arctica.AAC.1
MARRPILLRHGTRPILERPVRLHPTRLAGPPPQRLRKECGGVNIAALRNGAHLTHSRTIA